MTARSSASHAERPQQPQKRIWLQAGISIQAVEIKPSAKPRSRQCRSSSCHHDHERTHCCRSIRAGYGSRQDMRGDLPRNAPLAPASAIRAHLPPLSMIALHKWFILTLKTERNVARSPIHKKSILYQYVVSTYTRDWIVLPFMGE